GLRPVPLSVFGTHAGSRRPPGRRALRRPAAARRRAPLGRLLHCPDGLRSEVKISSPLGERSPRSEATTRAGCGPTHLPLCGESPRSGGWGLLNLRRVSVVPPTRLTSFADLPRKGGGEEVAGSSVTLR